MAKKMVSKQSLDSRLSRIEGQIKNIRKMISEDKNCNGILIQLNAIKGGV